MPKAASEASLVDEDDLAPPLLKNVGAGRLAPTRIKLARSWETREFLEIGLKILQEDLIEYSGPNLEAEGRSRLFESLSRDRILHRASQLQIDDPRRILTVNMYRGRWEHKNKYTEDLIAYLFRLYPQQRRLDLIEEATGKLSEQLSLAELVRKLAATVTEMILEDPLSRLQNVIQTAMPRHHQVQEFSKKQYDLLLPRWALIYERVATNYGLPLKSGSTWLDTAILINGLTEGYIARARVGNSNLTLSSGEDFLTGGVLALISALLRIPTGQELNDIYRVH